MDGNRWDCSIRGRMRFLTSTSPLNNTLAPIALWTALQYRTRCPFLKIPLRNANKLLHCLQVQAVISWFSSVRKVRFERRSLRWS